jgi:peptide/nickel transport system permease protein
VAGMIVRRLLGLIPVLLIVSFGVFMLSALVPGDAAVFLAGGENATPEGIERVRDQLGLDDPLIVQYGSWLKDAARLDFGTSLFNSATGDTVFEEIMYRLPVTASVMAGGLLLAITIGVPLGIFAGMRPGTIVDRVCSTTTVAGIAVPNFFLALLLASLFAIQMKIFPAIGFTRLSEDPVGWLKSLALPSMAIGIAAAASMARQTRAAIIDVLGSNYVRTAWAKGGAPLRVIGKHALKNAAIPAVTVLGLQVGALLGGTVLVEQIFGIPGIGTYMLRALTQSDLPVIQGVAMMYVLSHVIVNLLVDISYGYLNPKVRVS